MFCVWCKSKIFSVKVQLSVPLLCESVYQLPGKWNDLCSLLTHLPTVWLVYCSVHVHTVALLPSAGSDARPAVHDRHRHLEPRLHHSRTAHRLPAVSWRERGRTTRLHHGNIWPSARADAPARYQTKTFLRLVPIRDVIRYILLVEDSSRAILKREMLGLGFRSTNQTHISTVQYR